MTFNQNATRPLTESANSLIARIVAARPDLVQATFLSASTGNTALTVLTQNEVFKSNVRHAVDFSREVTVLRHLAGQSLVADVPTLTWEAEGGNAYGMTRMHGEALSASLVLSLPLEEQQRLATQLGHFNAALSRAVTADDRKALGLQSAMLSTPTMPHHISEAIEGKFAQAMLGSALPVAQRLADYFTRGFDDAAQERKMVFVHPDLHSENVLYDRESGKLAVIDIGPGNLIDAERSFYIMRQFFPEAFVNQALDAFGDASGIKLTMQDLDVYHALYSLRMMRSDPSNLTEFLQASIKVNMALDVLEGKAARPAPTNQLPLAPPVQNAR